MISVGCWSCAWWIGVVESVEYGTDHDLVKFAIRVCEYATHARYGCRIISPKIFFEKRDPSITVESCPSTTP